MIPELFIKRVDISKNERLREYLPIILHNPMIPILKVPILILGAWFIGVTLKSPNPPAQTKKGDKVSSTSQEYFEKYSKYWAAVARVSSSMYPRRHVVTYYSTVTLDLCFRRPFYWCCYNMTPQILSLNKHAPNSLQKMSYRACRLYSSLV